MDIAVFAAAVRAHGELPHRGLVPVIGEIAHDSVARAAVRAVDERIAVTPVVGLGKLPRAVRTDRNIRGDERGIRGDAALPNRKIRIARRFAGHPGFYGFHAGERRRILPNPVKEPPDRIRIALHFGLHAAGGIARPAAQSARFGEPVQERTEPDPLHNPADLHPDAHGAGSFQRPGHFTAWAIFPDRNAHRSSSPSPVRELTRNSGASGLTLS